jgi:D-alanyl-D-alanine carboxypeptidase/D-alanyl-D-alanine-endopeptidase (penicillin-binding protein 4)
MSALHFLQNHTPYMPFPSRLPISLILFLLFASTGSPLMAQSAALTALNKEILTIDQAAGMQSANWGFCVMEVETGKLLASHRDAKSLITASTMKVVTTATALEILGPDFSFETYIEYDGKIGPGGVLDGNLYITGTGDPALGSKRFGYQHEADRILTAWVGHIKSAGIKSIRGQVIADAESFSSQLTPRNWTWEDMGNYYGAGASGLNMNENMYRLDFRPGKKEGDQTSVLRTDPYLPDIRFVNEVTTGPSNSGDNAWIFGAPYTNLRYLRGTIPPRGEVFSIKGAIPDPPLFVAQALCEKLESCEIPVEGNYTSRREVILSGKDTRAGRTRIFTHYSPKLTEIVNWTNEESINLFAECMMSRIGLERKQEGATEAGVEATLEHWKARGLDTDGMLIKDGSGLSPTNAMSCRQMADLLRLAYTGKGGTALYASLPVSGQSGTVEYMGKGTAAEGNLRAKSGYISNVRAFAGYVKTRSGKLLSFAMIANQYSDESSQMRKRFEKLMIKMAELP